MQLEFVQLGKLAVAAAAWILLPAIALGAGLAGTVEIWEARGKKNVKSQTHGQAVVFVAGFRETPAPGPRPRLAQRNKSFSQRVLVITQGETVEFPNQDRIFHNVWSRSRAKTFDLGLYRRPEMKPVRFPDPGIVTVFCNIHAQMIASILVLPNTKYAISDNKGAVRIKGIPPGEYVVYAWVEGAKPIKKKIIFTDGTETPVKFRLLRRRIPLRHLNKYGKPYKSYNQ